MGVVSLVLAGCRKEEEKPAIPPSSPASYMHDKAFMGKLSKERSEHRDLICERNEIARKMQTMVEAKRAELKTSDLKVVQAELEKDPAWRALYVACTNANAAVERHRREILGTVRERITPKKDISK